MDLLLTIVVSTTLGISFIPVILTILKTDKDNRRIFRPLFYVFLSVNSIWYSVLFIQLLQANQALNIHSHIALEIFTSSLLFITRFLFLIAFVRLILLLLNFDIPKTFKLALKLSGFVIAGFWLLGWLAFFFLKSSALSDNLLLYTDILIFFIVIISCVYLIYQTKLVPENKSGKAIRMLAFVLLIPMLLGLLKWLVGGILILENPVWERLSIHLLVLLMNLLFSLWVIEYGKELKGFRILKTPLNNASELFEKYNISKREMEVIQLICEGYTNQQIADKLFISIETVKDHNSRIFLKTGVKNRTQLARLFLR